MNSWRNLLNDLFVFFTTSHFQTLSHFTNGAISIIQTSDKPCHSSAHKSPIILDAYIRVQNPSYACDLTQHITISPLFSPSSTQSPWLHMRSKITFIKDRKIFKTLLLSTHTFINVSVYLHPPHTHTSDMTILSYTFYFSGYSFCFLYSNHSRLSSNF